MLRSYFFSTSMQIPDIIIAVDGYSSTGKSSFAKQIAKEFGFTYLDSGALYRGVTLFAMENGFIDDDCKIDVEALDAALKGLDLHFGPQGTYIGSRCIESRIRSLDVASKVSPIATVPQVRSFVDGKLREAGSRKRVVMDGRDIGTTVFPDADLKIFMTARPEVRARRRYDELTAKGQEANLAEILRNVEERDRQDSTRAVSPLRKADDAIVLDNSDMTREEQFDFVIERVKEIKQAHPCK